jgi:hypothetical protein
VGLSLRDGYLAGTLPVAGTKAFKHTSSLIGASVSTINVMFEFFNSPNDLPIASGEMANVWGDLYIGGNIRGTSSLSTSGPIVGASLSVTGNVSSGGAVSANNLAASPAPNGTGANVTARTFTRTVRESPGYACGATTSCPCFGVGGSWETTYPPPNTLSFWAAVSGPRPGLVGGTTLHPGANTFRFYTSVAAELSGALPDVFFTFHPTRTANIGQVFQMAGRNSQTSPFGFPVQTYDVTIFVANEVTLDSDFVFFLEANQTAPETPHLACAYPASP